MDTAIRRSIFFAIRFAAQPHLLSNSEVSRGDHAYLQVRKLLLRMQRELCASRKAGFK